jgi:hypothetical protein
MLSLHDFSKPFHVYTDSSDYQAGVAVIVQEVKPLAF